VRSPILFFYRDTYGGGSTCRNFEENGLSYEEWKSVLHLSTRWNFGSIRKLALSSIEPPTPHDRLLLARTYLVDDWVVPALSALCERTTPLTLSEARQMNIEDVVLVSTVREHIRGRTLEVGAAEIPLRVEAEQLIALGHWTPPHLRFPPHFPKSEASSPVGSKRATKEVDAHESDGVGSSGWGAAAQNNCVRIGEPARLTQNNRGEGSPTRIVETGAGMREANNVETQPTAEELRMARRLAKLRALEASRGARRSEEERAKREAEEAARRDAEGGRVVGLPGQWRGGWRVMPVSEPERAETGWFTRSVIGLGDRPNNEEDR